MTLLSLDEYTKIAEKIIIKEVGSRFLTDEHICEVVNKLIYADMNHDPNISKITTFRYFSAKLYLKRLFKQSKKEKRIKYSSELDNYKDLKDYLEQYSAEDMVNSKCLTKTEQEILREIFIEKNKRAIIAKDRNITKQAISLIVIKAIDKLRRYYAQNK